MWSQTYHRPTRTLGKRTKFWVSKRMKIHGHIKTCIQIFIAALFIIGKKWEQPKRPLADKQNAVQLTLEQQV